MRCNVTVITPSFNQGRFIERTILSVLSQEVPGLEHWVIDGGSTDETVSILRRYESRLRWISEKDRGQAHALNKGLERARGEIIGWLNSDDVYYPGAVAAACEFLAARPEVDVVYGEANHIDVADKIIEPYPTEPWDAGRLVQVCYICQPALFFRRRLVARYGLFNEQLYYCMDWEYWLRLARGDAKFVLLPQILAGSRMYKENKTLLSRTRAHKEFNDMTRKLLGRTPDRWLFNYAHAMIDERGVPRADRLRYAVHVSAVSLWAALRWNRRISRSMLRTTRDFVAAAARTDAGEGASK
jgi:glycosyltransferase involved in cell wall biosynthesis